MTEVVRTTMSKRILTIQLESILTIQLENNTNEGDKHDDETIVAEVLRLMRAGCTSGFNPTWSIDNEDDMT